MVGSPLRLRWGRWRVRLTVPGMALAAAIALLAPPAMESRDRLAVGVLAAALVVLVVNGVLARLHVPSEIHAVTPSIAWSWTPIHLVVTVRDRAADIHEVAVLGVGGIAATTVRAGCTDVVEVGGLPTGIYHEVIVEVSTSVPFGLVAVGRRAAVPLGRPLAVCPPPGPVDQTTWLALTDTAQLFDDDEVIGLRERRSGDRLRDLDWAAIARTGRLMVRQRDRFGSGGIHLVVESDVHGSRPLNAALHRAHSVGRQLLADGQRVEVTVRRMDRADRPIPLDPDREVTGQASRDGTTTSTPVTSADELARALAAATPGPVEKPDGPHLVCDPEGVRWR